MATRILIKNNTRYNTDDIRKIVRHCCEELGIKQGKTITIIYRRNPPNAKLCLGQSTFGKENTEGRKILITVPRSNISTINFVETLKHELIRSISGNADRNFTVDDYKSSWTHRIRHEPLVEIPGDKSGT